MKKIMYTLSLIALMNVARAQFTANNIAVLRVGDSIANFANTGNSLAIDQFTTTGTFVNTTQIPRTGANAVALSGTSTSEGQLTLSTTTNAITFIAYKVTPPNGSSLTSSTSATINRMVVSLDAAASISYPVLTNLRFSAGSPRSVVSNGTSYWAAGANSGVTYSAGINNIDTVISTTTTNIRVINIFAGQLFFATGSGTIGIHKSGTGIPTSSGNTSAVYIATGAGSSPYGFAFNNDTTICYIADDRASALGGIQKWTRSGSIWTLAYTFGTGTSNIGARGLVVDWTTVKPTLYATTAEASTNRIIRLMDSNSTATPVTLATANANTIYRGITLTPGSNALPVKYTSFKGSKNKDAVLLTWRTASESNNNYFDIQRSVDGKKFETIGNVKGNGTTNKVSTYSFTDSKVATSKTVFYRLKQFDFNGKAEFSKTVSVTNEEIQIGLGASLPNPFNNELILTLNATNNNNSASIVIMDMIGKTHYATTEQLLLGTNTITINTTNMPDGIYFIRASYNGQTYTQKIIKK